MGGLPPCVLLQAWQQAQVELVLRRVQGVKGTPCEGKAFDITFRWVQNSVSRSNPAQHRLCIRLCGACWTLVQQRC